MIRDPLYADIVRSLNGDLNGDTFERCVQDLLLDAYPTMVPMVGGDDAGFDAAVGTPEGPYPVCCTVDKRGPLANFKKNIATYLEKRPDGPKRAVVTTPRVMTPRKKRSLEDIAKRDFGVQIVNIYDQAYFAIRLYQYAEWRRELLGLTGDPPALSVLPKHPRPDRPPLVGRDEDIAWMRARNESKGQEGDLLLIGQPGLGKTYLHQQMAMDGDVLFAVENDPGRLANAIRAQRPTAIVVDDAHENIDLLRELMRLRAVLHADYSIHANSWPHAKDKVMAVLDLPEGATHELQPLTMQEVRELIEKLGIIGPDQLMYLLLTQAEGKPGLAAALVAAVERGEYESIWTGETIARRLLDAKALLGDETTKLILATLSMGGDTGLTVEEAASFLQVSPLEISRPVTQLAAGGVIEEVSNQWGDGVPRLTVRPPVLRGWLAKECFWGSAGAIDPTKMIAVLREDQSRRRGLAHTLMNARMRNAPVPDELIFEVVNQMAGPDDRDLWEHLAAVNERLADMLLDHHPDKAHIAAQPLLKSYPERTLSLLVDMSASNESESEVEAPRRRIREWIQGEELEDDETIARRQALMTCVEQKLKENPDSLCEHAWAYACAMHPGIDYSKSKPEDPRTITMYFGLVPHDQLKRIAELWPRVIEAVEGASSVPKAIREIVRNWCYPGLHTRSSNPAIESCELMKVVAKDMLQSLIPNCDRAGLTWARDLSRRTSLGISVQVDQRFHRIFGREDFNADWKTRQARRQVVFNAVIDGLLQKTPKDAMAELTAMEAEAANYEEINAWDRNYVYWQLIQRVDDPDIWLSIAMESGLPATHFHTMLDSAQQLTLGSMVDVLRSIWQVEQYRWLSVMPILSLAEPPPDLLENALAALSDRQHNKSLAYTVSAATPPIETMKALLTHPSREVRSLSAIAEWKMDPEGTIRDGIQDPWRFALLETEREDDYDLEQILTSDPNLAFDWAFTRVRASSEGGPSQRGLWEHKRVFLSIIGLLSMEQRRALLDEIDHCSFSEDVVSQLFDRNEELIDQWLTKHANGGDRSRYLALLPLSRRAVDDAWIQFAIRALDLGYSQSEIADTTGLHSIGGFGSMSSHYQKLIPAFEKLSEHPDTRLHPAAHRGLDWAKGRFERERTQERRNQVRGRL